MTMTRRMFVLLLAGAALACTFTAPAAADNEKEKAQLRERFKERYPAMKRLKLDGFVGETAEGYVAAVNNQPLDAAATQLVDAENRDRRRLYEILAQELGADVETVARQNARRNFERADQGEYLRDAQQRWAKKP
jgi:uncharacterized protein YdbL (DUF1318 family)